MRTTTRSRWSGGESGAAAPGAAVESSFRFSRAAHRQPAAPPVDAWAAVLTGGFLIRTDGAARGNPGPASLGAALYDLGRPDARDHRAQPDASISEFLGVQTNNVAEYTGTLRALELARELGAREVHLLLDSKLIVEQLAGRWRVKDAKLIPLWAACRQVLGGLDRWSAMHVPRAQNSIADALANAAIDRVTAGGPVLIVRRPTG